MSKTQWLFRQLTRQLWFRSSLFAVLAVVTALVAIAVKPFIPVSVSGLIGTDAVDKILSILASSMLAVTTFSLNIMVSAYNTASSSVTPRATKLLLEDRTTQNVLATFIGSFLYSLVGIVALGMGAYGSQGRAVLFFVTLIVIVMIVITLLRWIQHLSDRVGYLQHIDLHKLSTFAKNNNLNLYLGVRPGAFLHLSSPLLHIRQALSAEEVQYLRSAFTIGEQRSFDQDPRFGLCVLSEIASRALSPAVNDPGTAIDIIGRAVRLLCQHAEAGEGTTPYPRLFLRPADIGDLFDDIFMPIARDGAALVEVHVRLQKALLALAQFKPALYAKEAGRHSRLALERAREGLTLSEDIRRLEALATDLAKR